MLTKMSLEPTDLHFKLAEEAYKKTNHYKTQMKYLESPTYNYKESVRKSIQEMIYKMAEILADPSKEAKYASCPCHMAEGIPGWCGVAGGGVPGCDH